jgi:hypothetical protein
MEQAATIDLAKARDLARAMAAALNREGLQCPTFARVSQNVSTTVALLDTLPAPSTDELDKVYHQLKDILGVTFVQHVKSLL